MNSVVSTYQGIHLPMDTTSVESSPSASPSPSPSLLPSPASSAASNHTEIESSDGNETELLSVSWNQDYGCFAAGTSSGFRIYNCEPFNEAVRRSTNRGFGIVELLFRSSCYALVGGGDNPQCPPNKVMIWDDHLGRVAHVLNLRADVLAGLQLRIPPSQQKKPAAPKPLARPSIFGADDDEDVEKEISRQASKNKAAQKVEEQHKKALAEDPSVFDYDGVFDEMKGQIAKPRVVDRTERQAKYIPGLLKKSEERKREQDVIYERKLLKERSKDDHLFADKEKFVTKAYKQKLAEEQKWLEEERLRQIREEKEDVTKMKDMSSFYFGLDKNIAFGASSEAKKPLGKVPENDRSRDVEATKLNTEVHIDSVPEREEVDVPMKGSQNAKQEIEELDDPVEASRRSQAHSGHAVTTSETTVADATSTRVAKVGEDITNEIPAESFKRTEDAVSAARDRYLARKRAREQEE